MCHIQKYVKNKCCLLKSENLSSFFAFFFFSSFEFLAEGLLIPHLNQLPRTSFTFMKCVTGLEPF